MINNPSKTLSLVMLQIGKYRKAVNRHDIGEKVNLKAPGFTGLILQEVKHTLKHGKKKPEYNHFTEAWTVKHGKITPEPGDWFLAPKSMHKTPGSIKIDAHMWLLPTKHPDKLKLKLSMEDADSAVSGVLPSQPGRVPKKYRRKGVDRFWHADWEKAKSPDDMVLSVRSD